MAAVFIQDIPFHPGEAEMMRKMNVPVRDNPSVPGLSPQLANHLQIAPLISIGTLDSLGRPWTTLWGSGEKGMARPLGNGIVGIRTPVTGRFDPVVEELVGKEADGAVVREDGNGRMVSGLTIDLETRKRVKLFGRMVAGALGKRDDDDDDKEDEGDGGGGGVEVQLVLKIEQSLGNCPKYLNRKRIEAAVSRPEMLGVEGAVLSRRAIELVEKADLFFVSSSQPGGDMDTNHRGGSPGFLRVESNDESGAVLYWPEYSGNRLYQTLGNLLVNPLAGICIPDFENGDMLYLTGATSILVGKDAAAVLPKSNLVVKFTTAAARFVMQALPFRGVEGDRSPYNPLVRYLATEKSPIKPEDRGLQSATLLKQTVLTPTISRFTFALQSGAKASFKPGQYVTMDLSSHLDIGYSHMRDDDPRSINDDFVRTFTVSSPPPRAFDDDKKQNEFGITIRKVGVATDFLFKYGLDSGDGGWRRRPQLDVDIKGFGGEFEVRQPEGGDGVVFFVAAGVGVTPILPSLEVLDLERLRVLWTVREEDSGLVLDTLKGHPGLAGSLRVFVTNAKSDDSENVQALKERGATVHKRRIAQSDLDPGESVKKYYLCTSVPMRKQLEEWLAGEEVVFEDFNF